MRIPPVATLLLVLGLGIAPAAEPAASGTVLVTISGSLPLRPKPGLLGGRDDSLHETTVGLRKALRSPEHRVVIDLSQGYEAGVAASEELAAVIRSGKRENPGRTVTCLVDGVRDAALVIAAACDEVVMADAGTLDVAGVGLDSYYFADALAKVGVRFHAVASGPHKTAHEPFTRNGPSPEGAAELAELGRNIDRVLLDLGQRPNLSREALVAARARSPQTPAIARETRLVDALAEPGEWLAHLPEPVRHQGDDHPKGGDGMANLAQLAKRLLQGEQGETYPQAVAVVELEGEITGDGESMPGESIAPADTVEMIEDLTHDERIKAVVLRINSPGGDAGASDRIHHAVRRLAAVKPVVALFDGVAASGGYYIGCAASEIQVHRGTITGSIGVFALVPDVTGTLDLVGIHRHSFASGPRVHVMDPAAPFSDERRAALQQVISDVDQRFQKVVADNRHLEASRVAELAGGRVFTGEQAVANGLADGFGSLATAVAAARKRAGIDEALPLERHPKDKGLLARFGLGGVHAAVLPAQMLRLERLATTKRLRVMAWANVPTP